MEYINFGILIIIFLTILIINKKQNKRQMATNEELVTGLNELSAQVAKIGTETTLTLAKVAELEAALANAGNVSPEVEAAFLALKDQVTVVDDLIPDAQV